MIERFLKNRFLRNVASLQVGAVIQGFGGLASVVLLAHLLGAREQGEYYVALAMYAALGIVANIGLNQVAVHQVAGAAARGLDDKVAGWLAFLAKAYIAIGLLLPTVGWFVLPAVGDFISRGDTEPHPVPLARLAWILTFMPLAELPRQVVAAALQGTRRMTLLAKTENVQEMIRVACVAIGALGTFSAIGPIIGTLVASALGSIVALELYREARETEGPALPSIREIYSKVSTVPLRHGIPMGVRVGTLRSTDAFAFDILPPLIVRSFASPEFVAYFKVAHRIMNVPMMFMQGISRTALPALSALRGLQDMDAFRVQWNRVTMYGGGIVAAGILLALPLIPTIAGIAFPEDYVNPVWSLALILALGFVPCAFCVALDSFFIVADRLGFAIGMGISGLIVSTAMSISLSQADPDTGAAWGYAIAKAWPALSLVYIWFYFRGKGHRDAVEAFRRKAEEEAAAQEAEGVTAAADAPEPETREENGKGQE